MTVANFVGLATGQKPWTDPKTQELKRNTPFFNGLIFHRVIPDFMVQGGDPLGVGRGGPGYDFADEIVPGIGLDGPGLLAMANAGPGTNGSQFFITEKATPWLTGRHTVFGKCDEVDLVKKITSVPRDDSDRPTTPVTIKKVTIRRK
jgi:peptidyl-prolyl cis-trans isomerase A (cyclophilin A)